MENSIEKVRRHASYDKYQKVAKFNYYATLLFCFSGGLVSLSLTLKTLISG